MTIDNESIIPKYYQLKELLLEYIRENNISTGEALPSENALMKKFKVSRNTVRQAFDILEKEGIIYKVQGKGTFYNGESETQKSRSYLLGVITPVVSKSIYLDIINGIEHYAHEKRYQMILSNSKADPRKERESLEAMLQKGIDGLIIEPALSGKIEADSYIFKKLKSLSIPVVIIDCYIKGLEKPSITLDDRTYGYSATKHLIAHSHKRIGYVYKHEVIAGKLRYEGYVKALIEAELPIDPELSVAFDEAEEQDGKHPVARLTESLMKQNNPPTALLYFNDENAYEGVLTLKKMGYRIPDDVSVIGIDDSTYATIGETSLTTLAHPKGQMGEKAAQMVIDEIENPGVLSDECILIQPRIIIRKSVASFTGGSESENRND